jgi:hypothetical protein
MSDSRLTVAPLTGDHDEAVGIEVHGDAFGDLLDAWDIRDKTVKTYAVTSHAPGEQPRAYVVEVHELPGPDGETQRKYACTCPAYKYHELPYAEDVDSPPEALADIGPCKHAAAVRVADRSAEDRPDGQLDFESLGGGDGDE